MAILSFTDDAPENFFYDGVIPIRAGWAVVSMQVLYRLEKLHSAKRVQDMALPPGNQLHRLHGDLADFYSVRINRQWRLIFQWKDGDAYNVNVIDYH